ncbi:uncharacterized protein BX663DRAFT_488441 [Cokeromyces recurvatus]|uniref:uncharacterized protein n=1 Tax=Cokeromyces recurvatus TaxID=90255 RepID=UPI00221F0DE2|nr:uncharacterized protein BX663DRAFT_488441 [Cokeromyces recurvatus]KAI7900224.1 hypothetical protein BX663DRAFT_488441 [Cokeromyces recurvatus]
MSSYFDELGIQSNHNKKKTYDVDLDAFMNPQSGSLSSSSYGQQEDTVSNVQRLIQAANFFRHFQEQMQAEGDADQEQFLDNLVSQLLEESQSNAKGPPPASRRFIDTLPVVKQDKLNSDETCIICKDNLKTSESIITQMPCGHYFDRDCIVPWLELHNTCPLCRFEVETEKKVQEEEEEEQRSWMYG